MPTWTEQSDLRFALHASQGEFPRVVLAPGDHAEAFELAWRAFNIADHLQTPVIILGDTYLSDNRATIDFLDAQSVTIERGLIVDEAHVGEGTILANGRYARYAITANGVSPRVLPGVEGAVQLVNSYEHDEYGYGAQGEAADTRVAQNQKRLRKALLAEAMVPEPRVYGPGDPHISILLFGSTKMPVLEALEWLMADGIRISVMQLPTLAPFPASRVAEYLAEAPMSLVIEGNATGQLEGLVREHCLIAVDHHLRHFDGRPVSPELVYAKIKELLGESIASSDTRSLERSKEPSDA
jgi:2-oxoglutarate ferredoxin oxidoreductase subunit alpha